MKTGKFHTLSHSKKKGLKIPKLVDFFPRGDGSGLRPFPHHWRELLFKNHFYCIGIQGDLEGLQCIHSALPLSSQELHSIHKSLMLWVKALDQQNCFWVTTGQTLDFPSHKDCDSKTWEKKCHFLTRVLSTNLLTLDNAIVEVQNNGLSYEYYFQQMIFLKGEKSDLTAH